MNIASLRSFSGVVGLLLGLSMPGTSQAGVEIYRAMGVDPSKVLAGTVLDARVLAGPAEQAVCIASYLTGKTDPAGAVNVKLAVFDRLGDRMVQHYARDFGEENGGHVGNGNLQLLDLDLDGVNEIIVSYDNYADPLIEQQFAEVIVHDGSNFRTSWSGLWSYDATRAARSVPREHRDRFVRDIDLVNTLRTRGVTLFLTKRVIAVAGERLPQTKTVQETFPLQPASRPR